MIVRFFSVALFVIYPFALWQLFEHGLILAAAALLFITVLLGAWIQRSKTALFCAAAAGLLALCAVCFNQPQTLKLYPVMVNIVLLAVFALSLTGTSVVERLARLKTKNLPDYAISYCRRVTVVWCLFFIANALIALDSALFRSDAWWALYNGAISYGLIGLMFAVEFVVRLYVQHKHNASGELP